MEQTKGKLLDTKQQWRDRWLLGKDFFKSLATSEIKYNYEDDGQRQTIVEALSFWKFISDEDSKVSVNKNWEDRKEILSIFLDQFGYNILAKIVILLESLPTPVFRQVIWKNNIDFMSPESFLRRLGKEQIHQIYLCYQELWEKKIVPSIFGRKRISYQEILASEFCESIRYINAGAMSYNLLGLDFGFNAYPKGVNNDTKVVEVSPLRFLSVKNHADDFIVNQEDGKYFWLYRMARSNYVFNHDKKVKLKSHICPGFWATLLVHFLFWFVSPLAAVITYIHIFSKEYGYTGLGWWLTIIAGSMTQLWLLLAIIKYSIKKILKFLPRLKKRTRLLAALRKCFRIAAFVIGCLMILGGLVILIFYDIPKAHTFLILTCSYFWAVFIEVTTALLLIKIIVRCCKLKLSRTRPVYKKIDKVLKISVEILSIILIVKLITYYFEYILKFFQQVWQLVVMLGSAIIALFSWLISSIVWLLVSPGLVPLWLAPVIFAGAIIQTNKKNEEQIEERWQKMAEIIKTVIYCQGLFVATEAIKVTQGANVNLEAFIVGCVSWFLLLLENIVIISNKAERAVNLANAVNTSLSYGDNDICVSWKKIQDSEWLNSFPKDSQLEKLLIIVKIVNKIFWPAALHGKISKHAYNIQVTQIMNKALDVGLQPKKIKKLQLAVGRIKKSESRLQAKIFLGMLSGLNFDQALIMAKKEAEKSQNKASGRKEIKKLAAITAGAISFPAVIIITIVKKLIEGIKTFYRLYELFNKICPYITEQRRLKI